MENLPSPEETQLLLPPTPTVHRNASWGAIIAIVMILGMISVGAFYAWGKRVAEYHHLPDTAPADGTY